jgi:hypothetical protein
LNRGIEVIVNTTNIKKNDFSWSTVLTFASNHEEITSFVQDIPVQNEDTWLIKGYPIQSYYDYKYVGIFQTDAEAKLYGRQMGDVKIEEVPDSEGNVDKVYNTADRQVIGSPVPKWTAGLLNTISYKGFDLSVFFDARWGSIMNYSIMGWYNPSGKGNGPVLCDYWTPENPEGYFPRPNANYNSFSALPVGSSSLFYIDASYIKLRNLTLGYTIPKQLLRKFNISKLRIYATTSNPWIYTKSKYLKDYDPERGGADEFPLTRQLVFGINVSF